jgi:Mce-associated membrane protein
VTPTVTTDATSQRERMLRRVLVAVAVVGLVVLLIVGRQANQAAETERAGQAAMKTARTSVPAILSYTDSGLSAQLATNRRLMTPDYAKRYASMVKARVLPHAEKYGVANQVGVVSIGTVRSSADSAVILVFANQTTRTKEKPDGLTQGTRLEVTLRLSDGRWLVDDMKPL